MLRRTTPFLAGDYAAVVVGGGAAGCHIAARLAGSNIRTLLLEEGPDPRKKKWYTELPSSKYFHRLERRYEIAEQTTPQNQLAGGEKRPFSFPRPMVLGGAGVMGGRSWILGDVEDWKESGLDYKKDIQPSMIKTESMETSFEPHRGRRGRFFVHPALGMSPLYRPFLEACAEKKIPLVASFNKPALRVVPSCGRPEVCIDKTNLLAQTSLRSLEIATSTLNPLHVGTSTKVTSIITEGTDKTKITGVAVRLADGSTDTIKAGMVVLSAGSVGTPRILQASREALNLPKGFGAGYWDSPEVILQYRCRSRVSMQCLKDPVVRYIAKLGWKFLGHQTAFMSGFDDMIAYVSTKDDDNVDVKLTIQPFCMGPNGEVPPDVVHGFQILVQLLQPKSRGTINSEGVIDPNYFAEDDDRVTLKAGVELAKSIMKCNPMMKITDGNVIGEHFTSAARGGVCRTPTAVDPSSYLFSGMSNLYVCDGSIIGTPLRGDYLPSVHALTDRFVEGYIIRDAALQKLTAGSDPYNTSKKIIDRIDRGGSSAVKIVY